MMVQWNPWMDLNRLESAVNHLFANRPTAAREAERAAPAWQPAVDVYEDSERIVLEADLPGVAESDLDISLDKNLLTVRGERRAPDKASELRAHRVERVQGTFARVFTVPPSVDPERVQASLRDGVLRLTLGKRTEAQPRQIKVQAA